MAKTITEMNLAWLIATIETTRAGLAGNLAQTPVADWNTPPAREVRNHEQDLHTAVQVLGDMLNMRGAFAAPGIAAAPPKAPAALDELRKIAEIAACWGCDHPDAPDDTELLRRVKWAARQLRAMAAPAAPAVDPDPLNLRAVGEALVKTIAENAAALEAAGWNGPMDCPSEVVVDLLNLLDEAKGA